jgi:hypothetical protein
VLNVYLKKVGLYGVERNREVAEIVDNSGVVIDGKYIKILIVKII